MRVRLMYPDRDLGLDVRRDPPRHAAALVEDLGLDAVLAAMARDDGYLFEACRTTLLCCLTDPEPIRYRQRVLTDCLRRPEAVRALYDVTVTAARVHRRLLVNGVHRAPDAVLRHAVDVLAAFVDLLRQVRTVAEEHGPWFESTGLASLCATVRAELSEEYLGGVERHLERLRFPDGVLVEVRLGPGNKGTGHALCDPARGRRRLRLPVGRAHGLSHRVAKDDEPSVRARDALLNTCLAPTADLLSEASDHVLRFFSTLRRELAFYVGCLNLHERLADRGEARCLPEPVPAGAAALTFRGLYDVGLSLRLGAGRAVGNDLSADGTTLLMVTGANRGGKSTFLRSLGLAQLMMQAGMFVAAESFRAEVRGGVVTHFRRGEDATMTSGKLDEELARMSDLADHLRPGCLALFNESFAATNEHEGSQIARQVVRALHDAGVRTVFVTHLYELAHRLYAENIAGARFLRAQRQSDGGRTFRILEGAPLPTGFGADLYQRVFGTPVSPPAPS